MASVVIVMAAAESTDTLAPASDEESWWGFTPLWWLGLATSSAPNTGGAESTNDPISILPEVVHIEEEHADDPIPPPPLDLLIKESLSIKEKEPDPLAAKKEPEPCPVKKEPVSRPVVKAHTSTKAKPEQITVHTSTPGGVQEKRCFSRDATVYDLRCTFRSVKGKQYKLLSEDGRELGNTDSLAEFLEDDVEGNKGNLVLTKVNVSHPIYLDMLHEITQPKKDSFKCEVFSLGFFDVTMGEGKYGSASYTCMTVEDPQTSFRTPGKLEPYRLGYDYFDVLEKYDIGEGRHRHRMLPARKIELEDEMKARLPQVCHVTPQIFMNPNRIHKLRVFLDKDEFPPTRENLYRFLNVFFDLLTDKTAMLL